jgi:hypothetical protein
MFSGSFSSQAEIILRSSAIFHLATVEGLGEMRLHVWPRGMRVSLSGQPAIHSHPWELCSLVIAGCYRDIIFRVKEFDTDRAGRLQGFAVKFGSKDEGDRVCPVAAWYDVTVDEERTIMEGGFHQMSAGVLHATQIPLDTFVATLLITNKVQDLSKLLLLGDGCFGEKSYVRPIVSVEELDHMGADLINALTSLKLRRS